MCATAPSTSVHAVVRPARGSVQVVRRLQGDLPVWVEADTWETTGEELDDIFIGDAEIWYAHLWTPAQIAIMYATSRSDSRPPDVQC